jgi:hypothetical protein
MGSRVNLRRFGTEAGKGSTPLDSPMNINLVVLISLGSGITMASGALHFLGKSDQDHFLGSDNGFDLVTRTHPTRKKQVIET